MNMKFLTEEEIIQIGFKRTEQGVDTTRKGNPRIEKWVMTTKSGIVLWLLRWPDQNVQALTTANSHRNVCAGIRTIEDLWDAIKFQMAGTEGGKK